MAGFTRYTSNAAYRVDVPTGWPADVQTPRTYFREPGGNSFLLIERGGVPNGDPLPDSLSIEAASLRSHADCHRIQLQRIAYRTFNAVDWEFNWRTTNGQALHVIDRNVVNGNHAYAIYCSVPDAQWAARRPAPQHVCDSFTPAE